jgi:putative ABC transport system permease protein
MAALGAFVSVFVVASTFALYTNQSRRELGLLRVIGATPKQVRRLLFRQTLGVGLAGSVVGAAAVTDDTADMATFSLLGTMALVVGATVLAPSVVGIAVRILTWPLSRFPGATAMLVRANALTAVRRTAATAAPVLLTVAFAVLITGNVATTAASYAAARAASVRVGQVLVPDRTRPVRAEFGGLPERTCPGGDGSPDR